MRTTAQAALLNFGSDMIAINASQKLKHIFTLLQQCNIDDRDHFIVKIPEWANLTDLHDYLNLALNKCVLIYGNKELIFKTFFFKFLLIILKTRDFLDVVGLWKYRIHRWRKRNSWWERWRCRFTEILYRCTSISVMMCFAFLKDLMAHSNKFTFVII